MFGKTLRHISLWLLDVDNTLYDARQGMLDAIHEKMRAYIAERLHIDESEAVTIQEKFWNEYGTTFLGLHKNFEFEPEDFLSKTHDIAIESMVHIRGSRLALRKNLEALPGKRYVLTNGPDAYAKRILKSLRVYDLLSGFKGANSMRALGEYHSKPERLVFELAMSEMGKTAHQTAFIDDGLPNLRMAKRLGITTVWYVGYSSKKRVSRPSYVDFVISNLSELGQYI